MQFEPPLIRATLIKRYKRFLADVRLEDGREVTAHVANPGAMTGVKDPGLSIWVQPTSNPKRKLKFSWMLVDHGAGHFSGVDTTLANRVVAEALADGRIGDSTAYPDIKPEQKYGTNARVDFLLSGGPDPDLYLEVKNVHLSRKPGLAEFPDSVTARGTKHLQELTKVIKDGKRARMIYLVQRTDATAFALASDIDPTYASAFREAVGSGLEVQVYDCVIRPEAITLGKRLDMSTPKP